MNSIPKGEGRIEFEEFSAAVTTSGYPEPSHSTYWAFLNEARSFSIFDKQELAMILAQFIHDSEGFVTRREKVDLENYPESYRDLDCDVPGQLYHGRGYLKVKLCKNYREISMDLFGNDRLVQKPEELVLDEETAIKAGFAYWTRNIKSYPGVSEGQFGASTNALNGASECTGENMHVAKKRFEIYKHVRKAFKLNDADPNAERGCYEVAGFINASQPPKE